MNAPTVVSVDRARAADASTFVPANAAAVVKRSCARFSTRHSSRADPRTRLGEVRGSV
jgi:hypothetical protein